MLARLLRVDQRIVREVDVEYGSGERRACDGDVVGRPVGVRVC